MSTLSGTTDRLLSLRPNSLLSLRPNRLVVVFAIASYAILIALTMSALTFGGNAVRHQVDQGLLASATASAENIGQILHGRASVVAASATDAALVGALQDSGFTASDESIANGVMDQLRSSIEGSFNAFVADPRAVTLAVSPREPDLIGVNFAQRDWYAGIMAGPGPYLSTAYASAASGHPLVVAAVARVLDPHGRLIGILGATFDLGTLQRFVDSFATAEGVNLLVIDQGRTTIAQPGGVRDLVKSSAPSVASALRGNSGNNDTSPTAMAAFAPIPGSGWALVAEVPTAKALADLQVMQGSVLLNAVLLAAVNLGVVLLLNAAMKRRIKAEAQLAFANQQLETRVLARTAELEASNHELEAFTYSVSHDLRAPLRAMAGFASLLEKKHGPRLGDEAGQYVHRIEANATKMGNLIDELLRFARVGRADMQVDRIDPTSVARAAIADLQQEATVAGVEIVLSPLPGCQADAGLLQQVYANLLSNAIKFSAGRPGARVELGAHNAGGETVYDVSDNGVGFEMRYAQKLFGVFQRLHSEAKYEGTGVGLALVQRIIHRHGGRVWAEAELDNGATFHFTLGARPA